jgi:hypothetical protein
MAPAKPLDGGVASSKADPNVAKPKTDAGTKPKAPSAMSDAAS